MIKNNVIQFGYGTILVYSSDVLRFVEFRYIEPPKEIGVKYSENDLSDVVIQDRLRFNYGTDMRDLYRQLEDLSESNPLLQFRGYTFDFTKFNEESVNTIKSGFKNAIIGFTLPLAC